MPFGEKRMKKDVVGPMSLPGGAVVCVQNLESIINFRFSGFQLMPFYTDRQTDRQTDNFMFLYIYRIIMIIISILKINKILFH